MIGFAIAVIVIILLALVMYKVATRTFDAAFPDPAVIWSGYCDCNGPYDKKCINTNHEQNRSDFYSIFKPS